MLLVFCLLQRVSTLQGWLVLRLQIHTDSCSVHYIVYYVEGHSMMN